MKKLMIIGLVLLLCISLVSVGCSTENNINGAFSLSKVFTKFFHKEPIKEVSKTEPAFQKEPGIIDEKCKGPYIMEAPPDFSPDATHTGDLVISGNEVMIIENQKYLQQGNVYINDEAKLVIRASQFALGRGDVPTIHVYITVNEGASLEIENSMIFPEPIQEGMGALVIVRNHGGQITITNSPTSIHLLETSSGKINIVNSSMVFEIGGLLQVEGGDVKLIDSTIGAIGLAVPADSHLTINGLRSGNYFELWDIHGMIPDANYNLIMERSCILKDDFTGELEHGPFERGWQFFIDPSSHVNIYDSELRKAFIHVENEKAQFENLRMDAPSNMAYRDILLTNVIMKGQWPFTLYDADLTLKNSEYLFLQPHGNSNLSLINSHIVEFIPRDFFGTVIFENGTWTNAGEIIGGEEYHSMENDFTIKGSLEIGLELRQHLQWKDAQVTREYDIIVNGEDDEPIPGAMIEIDGMSFVTNPSGKAKFNLVFNEFNYNQPKTLEVFKTQNPIVQREVDFFTKTPIIIGELSICNGDGVCDEGEDYDNCPEDCKGCIFDSDIRCRSYEISSEGVTIEAHNPNNEGFYIEKPDFWFMGEVGGAGADCIAEDNQHIFVNANSDFTINTPCDVMGNYVGEEVNLKLNMEVTKDGNAEVIQADLSGIVEEAEEGSLVVAKPTFLQRLSSLFSKK